MMIPTYKAGRVNNSANGILSLINKVKEARQDESKTEPVVDLSITFNNLREAFIDVSQSIMEIEVSYSESSAITSTKFMLNAAFAEYKNLRIRNVEDIVEYKNCVESLVASSDLITKTFTKYEKQGNLKEYFHNSGSCCLMTKDAIHKIFNDISTKRPFTLLDINCGHGQNIQSIKAECSNENVLAYGIHPGQIDNNSELEDLGRATERFIYGVEHSAKYISNKAFDMVLVSPHLTFSADENGLITFDEEFTLKNNIKYLREDGVFMFIIPRFRISTGIARILSRELSDINVYLASGSQIVVITGIRKDDFNYGVDPEEYSRLREISICDGGVYSKNKYALPESMIEIATFRGGKINKYEMDVVFNNSSAFDAMLKDMSPSKDEFEGRHSILPFTVGQLGLVLTSGCMDGLIRDENGGSHLIKGRIIKNVSRTQEVEDRKIINTSTFSNHVEIQAFLPTGELKRLS